MYEKNISYILSSIIRYLSIYLGMFYLINCWVNLISVDIIYLFTVLSSILLCDIVYTYKLHSLKKEDKFYSENLLKVVF